MLIRRKTLTWLTLVAPLFFVLLTCPSFSHSSPDNIPDKLTILSLLREEKFKELDALLSSYQKAYENRSINETVVSRAFHSFSNSDPMLEVHLNKWLIQMPKSYSAYLARGIYYEHLGWLSRGFKFAEDTSQGQFKSMKIFFALASKDLKQALSLNPKLIVAYEFLMRISTVIDRPTKILELLRKVEQFDPSSFMIRSLYLFSLQPKWGGSIKAMKLFINKSKKDFSINPKLKVLSGYVPYTRADMARLEGKRQAAVRYYNLALDYGEYWWFLYKRGYNYYWMKEYDKALKDFTLALNIYPQHVDMLTQRAWTYLKLERNQEALQDFNLAIKLDALKPYALRGRGILFCSQKQYRKGLLDFTNALKYGAHMSINWWERGSLNLYELKNYNQAASDLEKAIELNPYRKSYWYHYSKALYKKRDCDIVVSLKTYIRLCGKKDTCVTKRVNWAKNTLEQVVGTWCPE